jgi:hypothetical protein
MRNVTINIREHILIQALDNPDFGGASSHYEVVETDEGTARTLSVVNFQNGPIQEVGVNGCQNEDLIAIVIDRLRSFQDGPFPCRENAIAITKLEETLHWLNHRTADRQARGVEGRYQP